MAQDTDTPLSPFSALSYHFGMLLGVEDFATEQAYHRGKMRLHNAWLHRMGVVWGLDVKLDKASGEVRVSPGLAIDAGGRELHLDAEACLNVGEWFDAHKADVTAEGNDTRKVFDAFIAVQFKACLTRQVPALLDPCEGAGGGTAYSRIFETVDLKLLPGNPPPPPTLPYHRIRALFGLERPNLPADQDVVQEAARIAALAAQDQPVQYLAALRRFAALDVTDLAPPAPTDGRESLFPLPEDTPVVLATITGITLVRTDNKWTLAAGKPDITIRPTLIATTTIQELVCGPLLGAVALARPASTGPRVRPETVVVGAKSVEFQTDKDVLAKSIRPSAFAVSVWDDGIGWTSQRLNPPTVSGTPDRKVTVPLRKTIPVGKQVRFIAHGTGRWPIVGTDFAPLAGAMGGPTPIADDGIDFVITRKRS